MTERLEMLRTALQAWGLDALLLSRREMIAWLTRGADVHVVERSEGGVACLLVTASRVLLVTSDNERARLVEEETWPFAFEVLSAGWEVPLSDLIRSAASGERLGADITFAGAEDVFGRLVVLRAGLDELERQRITALGRDAAEVVETVGRMVALGWSERKVEAAIAQGCLERGIRPVCTLVAADDRIEQYRHPIPTACTIEARAMMVLGAERHGLNVSLTRLVHFGAVSEARRRALRQVSEIHAAALEDSNPGRTWRSIFTTIQDAYGAVGQPDGWRVHHQGGPAGYGCRDLIVSSSTPGSVGPHQAFSWNPSLPGVKSEDTCLHTPDGLRWITRSTAWPTIPVNTGNRVWEFADWLVRS